MAVQIGGKLDSGFDDPLGMLMDCHRRIECFLGILCGIPHFAQDRALSGEERQAVEAALGYFREAGPRHNRDEEDSLFPRLRECGGDEVMGEVLRLESEHDEASALHDEVAEIYSRWMASGKLTSNEGARLKSIAITLLDVYREHIQLEEEIVFPCAARLMAPQELAVIGAEFKARREQGS